MSDSTESTSETGSGGERAEREQTERERIRERKLAELRERLEEGERIGGDEPGEDGDSAAGDGDSAAGDGGTETPEEPVEIDGVDAFQRVIGNHRVVLVDCYADWCGPCQMMEPTIAALASETDAAVANVDVDANPELAQRLGARSIPTLLLYADGERVDRFVGAQDRATLESAIANYTN